MRVRNSPYAGIFYAVELFVTRLDCPLIVIKTHAKHLD